MLRKRGYRDFVEIVLSYSTGILRRGNFLFQKKSGFKIFMHRKGDGVLRFSIGKILSHGTEVFHWRTLVFRKSSCIDKFFAWKKTSRRENFSGESFGVSENFCNRKTWWLRGEESITIFQQKKFFSLFQNFLVEGLLRFRKFPVRKKIYPQEGAITIFCQNFCLKVPQKGCRWTFLCFRIFLLSEKKNILFEGWGLSRFFIKIISSHNTENIRRGTLVWEKKFAVEKILHRRGYHDFFEFLFVSQHRKNLQRKIPPFQKVSGIEKLYP